MIYLIVIIIVLMLVLSVTMVSLVRDKSKRLALGFLAILFVVLFGNIYGSLSYKNGQIDAITGNVKYELKTQADSTRVWVDKEQGE